MDKLIEKIMLEGATLSGNVLNNVPVCGLVSKNGYGYAPAALQEAMPMYEKASVYLNHKDQRLVEDKIGWIEGITFAESKGLSAAKFVMNEAHPAYAQIKWWAENNPGMIGFSHSIGGTLNAEKKMVEKISAVESVDLVAAPATVKGLRESIAAEKNALDTLIKASYALSTGTLTTQTLSESEKIARLVTIANELIVELTPKTTKESNDMDWTKLTLEQLLKDCPAPLIEAIRKDAATVEKRVLDAIAKVPEKGRTAIFEAQIRAVSNDQTKVDALVEDRVAVSTGVVIESAGQKKPEIQVEKPVVLDEKKLKEDTVKNLGL